MVQETAQLVYIAPAIIGLIISMIEIFFVMQDEGGMHPLQHGLHAIPTCLIFTYISMNAGYVGNYLATGLGWSIFANNTVDMIVIPIIIGLVATIKVKGAAAIIGGHGSIGEKLPHALIIGVLIAIAPFVWPLIAPMMPAFLAR
jgi:hypothetical protein